MLPSLRGLPLTVADSATAWAARTLAPPRAGPITVACVAGPGLRHAEQEVEAVEAAWRATSAQVSGGPAASTVEGLRRALTEVDVAHVAAHGVHQQQNPMFASLRLGDGDLFVHDLELGGVGAAHVVLSACDVGRSTVQPGDEALGLAAGLLKLGARSVLASVCPMPDGVASTTMSRYHRQLAEGDPADVALAAATEMGEPIAHGFLLAGSAWRAEPVG